MTDFRDGAGRRIAGAFGLISAADDDRPATLVNVTARPIATGEQGVEVFVTGVAADCFCICRTEFGLATRVREGVWTRVASSIAVNLAIYQIQTGPLARKSKPVLIYDVGGVVAPSWETDGIVGNTITYFAPEASNENYTNLVDAIETRPNSGAAWVRSTPIPGVVPGPAGGQMRWYAEIQTPAGIFDFTLDPPVTMIATPTFSGVAPTLTFTAGPPVYVGAAFTLTPGTGNGDLIDTRIELTDNTTTGTVVDAGEVAAWAGVVQSNAANLYMRLASKWAFSGQQHVLRSAWSTIITVDSGLDPAEPAFGSGDVTFGTPLWIPVGQSVTYKPVLLFPNLTTIERDSLQFQFTKALDGANTVWTNGARYPSSNEFYVLPTGTNPDPTRFDKSLPVGTRAFYIRYRFASDQEWSAESIAYTANPPSPPVVTDDFPPPDIIVHTFADWKAAAIAAPLGVAYRIAYADNRIANSRLGSTPMNKRPNVYENVTGTSGNPGPPDPVMDNNTNVITASECASITRNLAFPLTTTCETPTDLTKRPIIRCMRFQGDMRGLIFDGLICQNNERDVYGPNYGVAPYGQYPGHQGTTGRSNSMFNMSSRGSGINNITFRNCWFDFSFYCI